MKKPAARAGRSSPSMVETCRADHLDRTMVPRKGLEPSRLAAHGPEPCASTNSATWAQGSSAGGVNTGSARRCQPPFRVVSANCWGLRNATLSGLYRMPHPAVIIRFCRPADDRPAAAACAWGECHDPRSRRAADRHRVRRFRLPRLPENVDEFGRREHGGQCDARDDVRSVDWTHDGIGRRKRSLGNGAVRRFQRPPIFE